MININWQSNLELLRQVTLEQQSIKSKLTEGESRPGYSYFLVISFSVWHNTVSMIKAIFISQMYLWK